MSTERWLQISLAALASLGTLLLGLGQESPALPLMAIFAAVTSVVFTDALGWFRLNRILANLAALAAAVFSLSNFMFNDSEHQLMAIAHLLVYLQVILLYQQKTYRIYWELAVLSLLQVVVAAALNLGVSFGVMLAPYTAVAIFGMALFYLHRENQRFSPPERMKAAPPERTKSAGQSPPAVRTALPATTLPAAARKQAALLGVFGAMPLATPARQPLNPLDALMDGRLIRQIGALAAATACFAAVVFFATPRQSEAVWRGPSARSRGMVGFSKEVSLGRMRDVLQDNRSAMRVKLSYVATGKPFEPVREPYFRGAVLTEYVSRGGEGKWQRPGELTGSRLQQRRDRKVWGDVVRQEVVLEPRADESLFTIYPAMRVEGQTPPDLVHEVRLQQIFRLVDESSDMRFPYRYVVETAAFDDRWQRAVTLREDRSLLPPQMGVIGGLSYANRFPELKALALEILAKENIDRSDFMRIAYALEGYFRDASKFTYSLELDDVKQNPDVDPIVDFAVNHRTGHCQYFASAVALMLRTLGIPSRLVVGYRGGEYNALGACYQVRERDAHAWVEVWLPPHEVTSDMVPADVPRAGGAWLRIDPTPSARGRQRKDDSGILARAGDLLDYARILWADYVLGLNSKRQQESIYQPLTSRVTEAISKALGGTGWKDAIVRASARIGIDARGLFREGWFDWRASLATIIFCLILFAAYRAIISQLPRLSTWFARRRAAAPIRRRPPIEFYQRLERLVAQTGLTRELNQTQREFALAAAGRLQQLAAPADAIAAPGLVAETFYRVRYGGDALSAEETTRIERLLAALEAALEQWQSGKGAEGQREGHNGS